MKILSLAFLLGCFVLVKTHTYHVGPCPIVEPMQGFQINKVSFISIILLYILYKQKYFYFKLFFYSFIVNQKFQFLGIWYVIQKTSTASKCITYNYTRGEEPGEYILKQDSDHPVLSKIKKFKIEENFFLMKN